MIPMLFTAFVSTVLGVTLTDGQRVIAKVAYDAVHPWDLLDLEYKLSLQIFGDVDVIPKAARGTFVAVAGRGAGKSYVLGALRLLHLAVTVPLDCLAPGQLAAAVIVAPDLRLARITLRYVIGAAKSVPSIAKRITSETADGFIIKRPDGASVEVVCLPATRGGSAVRGRDYVCVLLDEAAFFRDETSTINDAEIVRAVGPKMLPGGQLLILSTPWLEQGVLYDAWKMNHGAPTTALVAHAPTLLLRDDPQTRHYVERETAADPDNARRELSAEFLGGGAGYFFDPATLASAVDHARPLVMRAPMSAIKRAGADLGLVRDSSALVIGAHVGAKFFLLETLELRPTASVPLKLSHVVEQFAAVLRRHELQAFTADHHVLPPAREWAQQHHLTIHAAPGGAEAKASAYLSFQQALREGRVNLPNDSRLIAQLRAVVARPVSGGGMRIDSPRRAGAHGDIVSAVILAHAAASTGGARMIAALESFQRRGGLSLIAHQFADRFPR